jgi:hypothetical protein
MTIVIDDEKCPKISEVIPDYVTKVKPKDY